MDSIQELERTYARLMIQRRNKLFNYYFTYWVVIAIIWFIYGLMLMIIIAASGMETCGVGLTQFLLTDLTICIVMPIYLLILLLIGRQNISALICYKKQVVPILLAHMLWAFVGIIVFFGSVNDCDLTASILLIGDVLLGLKSIVVSTFCSFYTINLLFTKWIRPEAQGNAIHQDTVAIKRELLKTLQQLQQLKASDNGNFKAGDDKWCIWMELLKEHEDIIVLPCHENHWMHNKCISEWYITNQRWPICKSDITKDSINSKLSTLRSINISHMNHSELNAHTVEILG